MLTGAWICGDMLAPVKGPEPRAAGMMVSPGWIKARPPRTT